MRRNVLSVTMRKIHGISVKFVPLWAIATASVAKKGFTVMRWALVPRNPFESIGNKHVFMLPMRGATDNIDLAARFSGVDPLALIDMNMGDELPTRDGVIRCVEV